MTVGEAELDWTSGRLVFNDVVTMLLASDRVESFAVEVKVEKEDDFVADVAGLRISGLLLASRQELSELAWIVTGALWTNFEVASKRVNWIVVPAAMSVNHVKWYSVSPGYS